MTMPTADVTPVLQEAIAAIAHRLAEVTDQRDAANRMLVQMFSEDRDALISNASITVLEGGQYLTIADVIEQRDKARDIAAFLEAETHEQAEFIQQQAHDRHVQAQIIQRVRDLCDHWHAVGKADGVSARHANALEDALSGVLHVEQPCLHSSLTRMGFPLGVPCKECGASF